MQLKLNSLIEFDNSITREQIKSELREWLLSKGYTLMQNQSFFLPEKLPSPIQFGNGIAFFHNKYNTEDPSNHPTYRRYFLSRYWDISLPTMTFFNMNPSITSACSNDPTVQFLMQISKHNNCGSLYVVNTSPFIKNGNTKKEGFLVDKEAFEYIRFGVQQSKIIVLA